MPQIVIRTHYLPLLQALLTGGSTLLGVLLVVALRPHRVRRIPFYSDATHNDPERVVLAAGENMACFFMPLVALAEYLHHARLFATARFPARPVVPPPLRPLVGARLTTPAAIRLNFACTLATTVFFFTTANLPSKRPFTPPHQLAASGLILAYAAQSVLKAVLAATFANYRRPAAAADDGDGGDDDGNPALAFPAKPARKDDATAAATAAAAAAGAARLWERHHMTLRLSLVAVLWASLCGTWLTFAGRKAATALALSNARAVRDALSTAMAVVVHGATTACVTLMCVMAVDMRGESVVLRSVDAAPRPPFPADPAVANGGAPLPR